MVTERVGSDHQPSAVVVHAYAKDQGRLPRMVEAEQTGQEPSSSKHYDAQENRHQQHQCQKINIRLRHNSRQRNGSVHIAKQDEYARIGDLNGRLEATYWAFPEEEPDEDAGKNRNYHKDYQKRAGALTGELVQTTGPIARSHP